jgi:glycosyltransferase involved in cell wall biosynthesis
LSTSAESILSFLQNAVEAHIHVLVVFVLEIRKIPSCDPGKLRSPAPRLAVAESKTGMSDEAPQFSIVTPSFRSSAWLKLCIASVADQEGVSLEHIVQDAGSDDGTLEWLLDDPRVTAFVEKDSGMYDAVNRGLRRAKGGIVAYLNSDEQYLPSALREVADFFRQHPDVDVVFGDVVVIGPDGGYRFHRKAIPPTLFHTWVCHLSTLTCATFIRRATLEREDLYFDSSLRDVGDGEWMVRALKKRVKMASLGKFLSAFGDTGANMSTKPNALRELYNLWGSAPQWVQLLRPLWKLHHRLRRAVSGGYFQKPFSYSVYSVNNPTRRETFRADRPTWRWGLQSSHPVS